MMMQESRNSCGWLSIVGYLGFTKTYNFFLFFIFAGALFGFTLARFQYLNYNEIFCGSGRNGAAPGECYYYNTYSHYQVGIRMHLICILPASLLAVFQFVPMIRRKAILFHRINGYIILLLVITSIAGALMIARHSFGGGMDTQAAIGFLAIVTLVSLGLSYYNIKRLRIDQHRAWMLRAWFYLGSIITVRIIVIIAAQIITRMGSYYTVRPCAQLAYMSEAMARRYSECAAYFDGSEPDAMAIVQAKFGGNVTQIAASLGLPFGMAIWLALAIHAIGIEVYLNLTPDESERLRKVSAERRAEAGIETAMEKDLSGEPTV